MGTLFLTKEGVYTMGEVSSISGTGTTELTTVKESDWNTS